MNEPTTTTDKPLRRGNRCPCLLDRLEVSRRGHDAAYHQGGAASLLGTGLLPRLACGRCGTTGLVVNPGADPPPPVGMREPCINAGVPLAGTSMAGLYQLALKATGKRLDQVARLYVVERDVWQDIPAEGRPRWADTDAELRARLLVAMGLEPAPPSPKINMADRDIARHEGMAPALVAERRVQREAEAGGEFEGVSFEAGSGVEAVDLSPPPERLTTLAAVHALADELWRGCHSAGTVIVDAATHEGERWTLVRCVLGPWSSDVLIEPDPPEHQVHMAVTGCWRDVSNRVAKGWRP